MNSPERIGRWGHFYLEIKKIVVSFVADCAKIFYSPTPPEPRITILYSRILEILGDFWVDFGSRKKTCCLSTDWASCDESLIHFSLEWWFTLLFMVVFEALFPSFSPSVHLWFTGTSHREDFRTCSSPFVKNFTQLDAASTPRKAQKTQRKNFYVGMFVWGHAVVLMMSLISRLAFSGRHSRLSHARNCCLRWRARKLSFPERRKLSEKHEKIAEYSKWGWWVEKCRWSLQKNLLDNIFEYSGNFSFFEKSEVMTTTI